MATATVHRPRAGTKAGKVPTSHANHAREMGHPRKGQPASRKSGEKRSSRNSARASEPGRFGVYGGRYVPETLMAALEELEHEYERGVHHLCIMRGGLRRN